MRTLCSRVSEVCADPDEARARIAGGEVLVDGSIVTNPGSMVATASSVTIRERRILRGRRKLEAALKHWQIPFGDAVALDAGAAAGGFTQALLHAGVRRVYAVEAGYGQLLGSLRQDSRVVCLERVNVGELTTQLVPDPLDAVTLDLGYLALALGVPQLNVLRFARRAALIALVKPMFELGLASPPSNRDTIDEALAHAVDGIADAGWDVLDWIESPMIGSRGARELFVRAQRSE